ncbi:zf-HC2 domain-containing protein [Corallococcus exiguus]|uniref:zf-HC2 domain-containing protein n=1 Tax=Corallococcus TaxID=83461 RepID=UPI000EBCECB5|nr:MULTISPECIES: zf-HC2 domain-containing protein [Corallococcus]NRD58563.1 zf-HC2 domain-containing protein [Corallococcus exiguus]NRD61276.1 zf-HC2 domain-containing protein [Corallococcus exiguus]RKI07852.1 zf-HC2 domain-containing protein [Corallococcus sp. AB030]
MGACVEYEEQASLHAAEALEGEEAARFQAHLESCAACQAEVASAREVLGLVALPPQTPVEVRAQEGLGSRTLAAWRREQTRRGMGRRALGSLAAVAAVVALMLGPSALERLKAPHPVTAPGTVQSASARDDVDAETLAAFEAWAGLDPLEDDGSGYGLDEDLSWDDSDLDGDFDLGETL